MRALAGVAIVAIIAITVLIIWLTARRRAVKREELRQLREDNRIARAYLADVRKEAAAQLAAGNGSHGFTVDLVDDYFFSHKGIAQ